MKNVKTLFPITFLVLFTLLLTPLPTLSVVQAQSAPSPGLFGLNMYITGHERSKEEARALIKMARQIGASWTREEISWATWGKRARNGFYDERIGMLSDAGIGIIGMLLTTPQEYRDPACVAYAASTGHPDYWCAPTDLEAFADWAGQVAERYDGDGTDDAPGSPRVAAWEIWNEPDQDGTWLPHADPVAYGTMLRLAYDAIKAADSTAIVLNGGVMTFDTIGVNAFMDRVVEVAGWNSFDALSLHPWLIDHAPDSPSLINPRQRFDVTIPGRIALAQQWVADRGGGKPIWITEVGWSTCGDRCEPQFAWSEDQQADYMVRTFVLAAANGVQHVSYFQLEDKFQGNQVPWSQAAIVRDDLNPKLAYLAYGTMVAQLQFAHYAGTGQFHVPGTLADYRFTLDDGGSVAVLWRTSGSQAIDFPLAAGQGATLVQRDGAEEVLPAGGSARLIVNEHPIYVHQSVAAEQTFAETGQTVRGPFLRYWHRGGGLNILGLPISPERSERGADGRDYPTQWFERARLELHTENNPPYDVLIGLLGVEALKARGTHWEDLPTVEDAPAGCRYFPETAHSLCPPFRDFWEQNGGLAVFGFPISEPFDEANAENGQTYTVQYFERNRFELHMINQQPVVMLGRLGAELMP